MGSNAGGFDFSLVKRNQLLEGKGVTLPKAWKTGTTIAGVMFKVCLLSRASAHGVQAIEHFGYICCNRMGWCWGLTLALPQALLLLTRTARRFTTLHPTSGAVEQEQQLIRRQSQVGDGLIWFRS
jgi:hypothetical protein